MPLLRCGAPVPTAPSVPTAASTPSVPSARPRLGRRPRRRHRRFPGPLRRRTARDRDVLADLMVAITRLARDGAHRGDLKLLTNAFKELRYAFKVFAPYHDVRKVSIFGSARTAADHPEFLHAVEFARRMRERQWMIITGAGDGIMGAAQDGAGRAGSFGVAIRLPHEQRTNVVIADDPKLIHFKYFFTRKILFLKEASAVALFPGGFGTQDEGFEALTMIQTGKTNLMPLVMIDAPGGTYWQHWRTYIKAELVLNGMIDEEDMSLFKLTDDLDEAVEEIAGFYRRYHSMRCVGPLLVLRLSSPLPARRARAPQRHLRLDAPDRGPHRAAPQPRSKGKGRTPSTPTCRASPWPSTARASPSSAASSTTSTRPEGGGHDTHFLIIWSARALDQDVFSRKIGK
ncbi:MAG: LOG family protein [Candidatus Moduliflexus flocculans]|nr:LOG family protein [Candidatus Moduliflexus flocculans]